LNITDVLMLDGPAILSIMAFSNGYLLVTTFILLRNMHDFTGLPKISLHAMERVPKISICIPARNEESTIEACVKAACEQLYPDIQVLVLDDASTDATPTILKKLAVEYPKRLSILNGRPKPHNWLGKPWACHQLSQHADGELFIFIDSDTQLNPDFVQNAAYSIQEQKLDFATVWPRQFVYSFWEKMLIPMIYHTLLTLLPAIYVYRSPRWLPASIQHRTSPLFAAACGQCMIFTRNGYHATGGHESVKNKVVEDVELARRVKKKKLKMRMFHGLGSITCRMYTSEKEIRNGFRKNFFAGFGYNIPMFLAAGINHLAVFILPPVVLVIAVFYTNIFVLMLALSSSVFIIIQRFLLSWWFRWPYIYGLLHPLAVLWFQYLAIITLWDYLNNRSVRWKGRNI